MGGPRSGPARGPRSGPARAAAAPHDVRAPANGHQCEDCIQFIAGPKGGNTGRCKVVAGTIANKGCCDAFVHVSKGTPDNG